jgi:predicted phage terminase large subunit-like protein
MPLLDLPPLPGEMDRLMLREECRRSLAAFVQAMWPVIEPGVPLAWSWAMESICDHLQAVSDGLFHKLLILVPPGHSKSTLVSVMWNAWEWTREPWLKYLVGSYDENLTYRDSNKCRSIVKSREYQELFVPGWQISRDQDSKGFFTNTAYGSRKTYWMASRFKTGWRGNRIIFDDPLSAEDRYNQRMKQSVIDSWEKTLSTRGSHPEDTAFVGVMQRLAVDDLAGFIIDKYSDEYVVLTLPAEFDPGRRCSTPIFADPRTEPGELLFPELFPREVIDGYKVHLGPVDYAAQFDHKPFPLGGNRFRSEFFQFWEWAGPYLIRLRSRSGAEELVRVDFCERFLTVDLAASEKASADFTAIGLWAMDSRMNLILLHQVKFKKEEPGIIEELINVFNMKEFGRNPPAFVGVEASGLGLPIAQNAKSKGLPVLEIFVHKDKIVMSANISTRIHGGQVFWPDPSIAPWFHEFSQEILAFPGGKNDDVVTMISLAGNQVFEVRPGTIRGRGATLGTLKPSQNAARITAGLGRRKLFGVT